MGNSLCKDKSPRRKYVKKSPIDEVLANGYQPAANGAYSQSVSFTFDHIGCGSRKLIKLKYFF